MRGFSKYELVSLYVKQVRSSCKTVANQGSNIMITLFYSWKNWLIKSYSTHVCNQLLNSKQFSSVFDIWPTNFQTVSNVMINGYSILIDLLSQTWKILNGFVKYLAIRFIHWPYYVMQDITAKDCAKYCDMSVSISICLF